MLRGAILYETTCTYSGKTAIFELSCSISVFQKMSLSDFWLKLENKGGVEHGMPWVEFFEWREEFQNAGQIFTPDFLMENWKKEMLTFK